MSGELLAARPTGLTLYAVVFDGSGRAWNTATSAFESIDTANWTDYDIPLAEQGGSGVYVGDFPAGVAAGTYRVVAYRQLGGSPASTDVPELAGTVSWDGQQEITPTNAGDGWDVETGINLRQALAVILAGAAGQTDGFQGAAPATGARFLAPDGSTPRITANTDANGNRTSVTLSPPS